MKRILMLAVAVILISPAALRAQLHRPALEVPSAEALSAARKLCTGLFDKLKAGRTGDIADWMISELGYSYSEADKITRRNDFKSKLDLVLKGPPASAYGKLDGYDLLDESYLPGTSRYFRYVYISYHQRAPLIWEFRYFIKPDGKVALNYIIWSEQNPFEYLATSAMRLPDWYRD